MRKLIMFNMVSVDGFYAATDGHIDWHATDDEFDRYAVESNKDTDTILFGRMTYQLFESYWPKALKDPATSEDDRQVAQFIQDATKIVFSKSLRETPTWNKTELKSEVDVEYIKKLKNSDGKNIVIFGSGTIVQFLANEGLIDTYKLMVNPVILGKGKTLFKDAKKLELKLVDSRRFETSGNVLLEYQAK